MCASFLAKHTNFQNVLTHQQDINKLQLVLIFLLQSVAKILYNYVITNIIWAVRP